MKLILTYTIEGGYECSPWNIILPVEYESAEALLVDFESKLDKAYDDEKSLGDFIIGNKTFYVMNFIKYPPEGGALVKNLPEIFTLEEWFNKNNIYS